MTSVETWLPVFSGFYNTIWDESERHIEYELYNENDFRANYPELKNIPWNFIEENFWDCVDYDEGNMSIAQGVTDAMAGFINEIVPDLVKDCKFEEIRSPREYNFTNDAIDVSIDIDPEILRKFLYAHENELEDYLQKRYTSRSGFFSSYPNTIVEWEEETKNFSLLSGHYLGSLLQFVAETEHGEESDWELYEYCDSNYHTCDYCPGVNTKRLLKQWEDEKAA